jgi:hypothetical protein
MNMNMNRNLNADRSYGVDKPSSKPAVAKRRALGDITNAVADEDAKSSAQNKKALVFKVEPVAQIAEAKEADFSDDRAYMQRAIDDIDGRDVDNPLLVTCYVNEMYDHFNQVERDFSVNCNYMAKQDFVNEKMRSILVDWLVRQHPPPRAPRAPRAPPRTHTPAHPHPRDPTPQRPNNLTPATPQPRTPTHPHTPAPPSHNSKLKP